MPTASIPSAPSTIWAFVGAIITGTPVYAIPYDWRQLAKYCAGLITEQAVARRKSAVELLRLHKVEDQLTRFRLAWWG